VIVPVSASQVLVRIATSGLALDGKVGVGAATVTNVRDVGLLLRRSS
jgi:hypothetical protein